MPSLIIAALVLALGFFLRRLWSHRTAMRRLHQAILQKQPLLREDLAGSLSESWDRLCRETNDLISEVNRLQRQRTGQLAQLEATLGSLQEAVLIVDRDNYILLANKALQEIFPRATNIFHQRLDLVLHSSAFLSYVEAVRKNEAEPQHAIEFADGRVAAVAGEGVSHPEPSAPQPARTAPAPKPPRKSEPPAGQGSLF